MPGWSDAPVSRDLGHYERTGGGEGARRHWTTNPPQAPPSSFSACATMYTKGSGCPRDNAAARRESVLPTFHYSRSQGIHRIQLCRPQRGKVCAQESRDGKKHNYARERNGIEHRYPEEKTTQHVRQGRSSQQSNDHSCQRQPHRLAKHQTSNV